MNKNGFMLVETLVSTTVILGALIFLFIQFSNIRRSYETSFTYDSIPDLYNAQTFAHFLETSGYQKIETDLGKTTYGYVQINGYCNTYYNDLTSSNLCENLISEMGIKKILFVGDNLVVLQNAIKNNASWLNDKDFDEGLKKYILQMNTINSTGHKRLIIEFKGKDEKNKNIGKTYASISINNE